MISPTKLDLKNKQLINSKPLAICAGRNAGVTLKERTKKYVVLVSDRLADLLHRAVVALKHALGCSNPQFLQVSQWGITGSFLEASHEISRAHTNSMRRLLEREGFGRVLVHPFLSAGNVVIRMVGFQWHDCETGLPGTRRFYEQRLGGLHGNF